MEPLELYLAKVFKVKLMVVVLGFYHLLDLEIFFPSQDSGQPIPVVAESCIRYINLYGESAFRSFFFLGRI